MQDDSIDLSNYSNKDNVWAYDDLTRLLHDRISRMPDRPQNIAVLLSWSDEEDASIKATLGSTGAAYDVLALKWFDRPFRLFSFALVPDSDLTMGDFMARLAGARFSECFLLAAGTAILRIVRLESIQEAQRKYADEQESIRRSFLGGRGT